jgi:hypothetical protein
MITELLSALRAVPKILDALERIGTVMTAQMAQQRKGEKDEKVDDLINAAAVRRKQRLSEREAQRIRGDSDPTPTRDGGGDGD